VAPERVPDPNSGGVKRMQRGATRVPAGVYVLVRSRRQGQGGSRENSLPSPAPP